MTRHIKGNASLPLDILKEGIHFTKSYHLTVDSHQGILGIRIGIGMFRGMQQTRAFKFFLVKGVLLHQLPLEFLQVLLFLLVVVTLARLGRHFVKRFRNGIIFGVTKCPIFVLKVRRVRRPIVRREPFSHDKS